MSARERSDAELVAVFGRWEAKHGEATGAILRRFMKYTCTAQACACLGCLGSAARVLGLNPGEATRLRDLV